MAIVVGVRFKKPGKMYYFDPGELHQSIEPHNTLVVETVRGLELGECVVSSLEIDDAEIVPPLRKVVRIATEADLQQVENYRENERNAYTICQDKIIAHKIEMKLVDVEYAFDNSKIIFYFTANGRVDFRSLVKDLASVFRTRIELRQIGVRDEAKMLGGLGPCGRPICCGTFLGDFQPVSIKMAKEQNLSLNPTKISGLCGRLMCCLKYEQENYEEARKQLPRIGKDVLTPDGRGHVIDLNILKQTAKVRISIGDTAEVREYPASDLQRVASAEQEKKQQPHKRQGSGKEPVAEAEEPKNAPAAHTRQPAQKKNVSSAQNAKRTPHARGKKSVDEAPIDSAVPIPSAAVPAVTATPPIDPERDHTLMDPLQGGMDASV